MMDESRKILDAARPAGGRDHASASRCVVGHARVDPGGVRASRSPRDEARGLLAGAPGVERPGRPGRAACSPRRSTRPAATSRSRAGSVRCPGATTRCVLFSCADNLRKGAALNAVQIAEHLYK